MPPFELATKGVSLGPLHVVPPDPVKAIIEVPATVVAVPMYDPSARCKTGFSGADWPGTLAACAFDARPVPELVAT